MVVELFAKHSRMHFYKALYGVARLAWSVEAMHNPVLFEQTYRHIARRSIEIVAFLAFQLLLYHTDMAFNLTTIIHMNIAHIGIVASVSRQNCTDDIFSTFASLIGFVEMNNRNTKQLRHLIQVNIQTILIFFAVASYDKYNFYAQVHQLHDRHKFGFKLMKIDHSHKDIRLFGKHKIAETLVGIVVAKNVIDLRQVSYVNVIVLKLGILFTAKQSSCKRFLSLEQGYIHGIQFVDYKILTLRVGSRN